MRFENNLVAVGRGLNGVVAFGETRFVLSIEVKVLAQHRQRAQDQTREKPQVPAVESAPANTSVRHGSWKLHLRHCPRCSQHGEIGVVALVTSPARRRCCSEEADESVVTLNRIVVTPALHCDAVLSAGQFVLQLQEVLVRYQLGIILGQARTFTSAP